MKQAGSSDEISSYTLVSYRLHHQHHLGLVFSIDQFPAGSFKIVGIKFSDLESRSRFVWVINWGVELPAGQKGSYTNTFTWFGCTQRLYRNDKHRISESLSRVHG